MRKKRAKRQRKPRLRPQKDYLFLALANLPGEFAEQAGAVDPFYFDVYPEIKGETKLHVVPPLNEHLKKLEDLGKLKSTIDFSFAKLRTQVFTAEEVKELASTRIFLREALTTLADSEDVPYPLFDTIAQRVRKIHVQVFVDQDRLIEIPSSPKDMGDALGSYAVWEFWQFLKEGWQRIGQCKHCGQFFVQVTRHEKTFCSKRCGVDYNNRERVQSGEAAKYMREKRAEGKYQ